MEQITKIAEFILRSFIHIWPYLVLTIPLAVVINLSGASKYISSLFGKNPLLAVFLATLAGAFSPFCSCGVIPVITSVLIGGVPLAPVMSFWIASPSMDPEIFLLSGSVIGWKLAFWRLGSTFIISLLAGYITELHPIKSYLGNDIIRKAENRSEIYFYRSVINFLKSLFTGSKINTQLILENQSGGNNSCCTLSIDFSEKNYLKSGMDGALACNFKDSEIKKPVSQFKTIFKEIIRATILVTRFMGFAFLITALINFYLPKDVISWIVNVSPATQVALATIIGIPLYTSNITALPLVGGLIELGLNQGAALSLLIAGSTTTLPAMAAVWGITNSKVFTLYISYVLIGALSAGLFFNLFG